VFFAQSLPPPTQDVFYWRALAEKVGQLERRVEALEERRRPIVAHCSVRVD
jgi:hypothetical protein